MGAKFCFIILLSLLVFQSQAQSKYNSYKGSKGDVDEVSVGVGLGLDYGGFGGNILVYPQENIGLFVGAGYAFAGLGYNVGAKFRFATKSSSSIRPYLIGMYGYNTAIAVPNAARYNKFFYGTSFGFGIDRDSRSGNGYWSFALLLPVRGSEVDNYINYLKTQQVVLQNSLSPIAFSIGYHFIIQ